MLISLAFIPQVGVQNDEALFGSAIYEKAGLAHSIDLAGERVPLMILSYLGSLKSLLYTPLFKRWKPSAASIRVPMILAGALTIWLFGLLLRRLAGDRAAIAGMALLATDTSFLLTTCFDWGPVALQHLFLVSGVLSILCFYQEQKTRFLFAGFLIFGLGVWDKALFLWMLGGLGIATLIVLPRQLREHLTLKNLGISILAFALGAAPLIRYNVREPWATFHNNAAWTANGFAGKVQVLTSTFSGQSLFGYIARQDPAEHPREPRKTLARLSLKLSEIARHPQTGFLFYAFLAALAIGIGRKPVLFFLIAIAVAWLQMLFGKGVGGATHHSILLWPFPTLIIAVAFAEASRRLGRFGVPLLTAFVALLAGRDLLVTNEYYADLVSNGPGQVWTDAIYPLSDFLKRANATEIYIDDWGMLDNLITLNRGRLPIVLGADPLAKPELDASDKRVVAARFSDPNAVFVGYPDGEEQFHGVNERLHAIAAQAGYREQMLARIPDRNGRTIYEVKTFLPDLKNAEH